MIQTKKNIFIICSPNFDRTGRDDKKFNRLAEIRDFQPEIVMMGKREVYICKIGQTRFMEDINAMSSQSWSAYRGPL